MDTTDFFAQVPHRIADALRDGDISFRQFGILIYLITDAHHATKVVKTTIGELKSALRLTESSDTIVRDLKVLLDQGWIEFEPRQGKGLYRIKLRRALRKEDRVGSQVVEAILDLSRR